MGNQNATPEWVNTRVATKLGIKYPIIQGPLGGLSSQNLTAAVSNYGGLGSFGAHGLTPSAIKDVIAELRSMTDKPFAMNLWVSMEDDGAKASDEAAFKRSLATLAPHIQSLGGTLPSYTPYSPMKFEEQARVLIDAKVPALSFIYGIPPKDVLDECRAKGIVIIGTATTPDEAIELQKSNVDVIAASGFEAGGHRGSFLLRLRGLADRDVFTRTASRRSRVGARRRGGWHCGRPRHSCRLRPRCRRRADRDGVPRLRRVRGESAASRGLAPRQGGSYRVDSWLHRKARTRNQKPVARFDERARRRNSAIPAPAFPHAEYLRSGGEVRPTGTLPDVGRAECEPCPLHEGDRTPGRVGVGRLGDDW